MKPQSELPRTKDKIDPNAPYYDRSIQSRAVINSHLIGKRKYAELNKQGKNQFSFQNTLIPYNLKYSLCNYLIKEGKSTYNQIMALTGLSKTTIAKVKRGEIKLVQEWADQVKRDESGKFTFLSNTILDSINSNDLEKSSLLQKVTSASILIDKRRLIDGQSTENISVVQRLSEIQPKADQADKLLETIKSRLNQ